MSLNFNFIKEINVEMEIDYYSQIKHIVNEALANRKILSHSMYALIAYVNEAMLDYEHQVTQFLGDVPE